MSVLGWKALERTVAAGGEASITWTLDPPAASGTFGLAAVLRAGVEQDPEALSLPASGARVTFTPAADYPILAGEVFTGSYQCELLLPAVRDWAAIPRTVLAGGEASVSFALDPAAHVDAIDVLTLTRNGVAQDPETYEVSSDGASLVWTPPAGYPAAAGEVLAGRYQCVTILPATPSGNDWASILAHAMQLVRSIEGLSVSEETVSDAALQVACESAVRDLLRRHGLTLAGLSTVDDGTGSDAYHFGRGAGFTVCARLFAGALKAEHGSFALPSRVQADDAETAWFGTSAVKPEDFSARADHEIGMVASVEDRRAEIAADFVLFGVVGPSRSRRANNGRPTPIEELMG